MSLRGNLNSVDLANIFQMLSINQKEGTLNIFDGDSKKSIYFSRDGVSMLSRGKVKKDTLGRILLRYDRLTVEQLDRALQKQHQSGRILGQVLEESRLVPREVIEDALRIQIEEEIYNLFIWKDASFEFIEGIPPKEFDEIDGTITRLTFNVNSLIMEAARRIDEWEHIQKIITSTNEVYQYTGRNMELTDDIFREPYCEKVLAEINGRHTVEEIIENSYVNKFEVCKILALLIEQSAIEPVSPGDLTEAANAALESGAIPEAIKFLERIVELGRQTPETFLSLGRAYEGLKEISRASEHYRKFAEECLTSGRRQEAFDLYGRITELLPTDLQSAERMIEIYVSYPEEFEGAEKRVIEKGKIIAEVFLEIGKNNRAIQTLHRVITLDPEDFTLRSLLVNIYLANNMSSEAIAEYEAMAEWHSRRRDWEQVIKILRKILVIDRNREDVNRRLEQLVNRKAKKKQNLRRIAILVVVVTGLSVLAYGYISYELEARQQAARAETEATEMLASLNAEVQPAREQLDDATKRLRQGKVELPELVTIYRKADELRQRYEVMIRKAIGRFDSVVSEYKFARAKQQALDRKDDLLRLRTSFESSISAAQEEIQTRVMGLVSRADQAIQKGEGEKALGLYKQAWNAAVDKTPLEAMDVDKKIENGERLMNRLNEMLSRMEEQIEAGNYMEARAIGISLLSEYFAPAVLNRLPLPIRVESRPAGARVLLNGAETGIVTPGWIQCHPGIENEIVFEYPGFVTAKETIPAARSSLPDQEIPRLNRLQTIVKEMLKEIGWSDDLEGAIEGRPVVTGNGFCASTRGSMVWRIDVENRTKTLLLDARQTSVSGFHAAPAACGDELFVATLEGRIRKVSIRTGETLWERPGTGMLYAPLALSAHLLHVGDVSGNLAAYDTASGDLVWQQRILGEVRGGPVVSNGRVVVVTTSGHLYAFEAASGARIWETGVGDRESPIVGSPLVVGDRIYAGSTDGRLYAFDLSAQKELWRVEVGAEIRCGPVLVDGVVIAATIDGTVHAVRDGTVTDRLEVGGSFECPPVADGSRMFLANDAGRLVCARVDAGKIQLSWKYDLRDQDDHPLKVRVSPILLDGRIVVLAESGKYFVFSR